jgi:NSS family neurotransmitter:Na+ symporter
MHDYRPESQSANDRGQWGSSLGFVLAAAGSAIGLGNIWRFPYVAGENGGAAFVILYLACILFICLPYLFAELVVGRSAQKNPVGAIKALSPNTPWWLVGGLGVLTGVFILSYYGVIAGWAFGYIFKGALAAETGFGEFIANPTYVVPLFALFLGFTVLVVLGGVEAGIERVSKILMPILLVLMFVVIIRGLTLPGAQAGLEFYLKPDFSKITGGTVLAALGQAFFSLSLGMGAMITYGSYLPKTANIRNAGASVAVFDTGIALLAGLMIFPAVFATGKNPNEGPALVFDTLPAVFDAMPMGGLIAVLFFILISIAALTSTVSLLEVVVSYVVDEHRWSRRKSVFTVAAITFVVGLPSALSQGAVPALGGEGFSILGQSDFLSLMDFIWGNISLALGALLLSVFVGWVWGRRGAETELKTGGENIPEGHVHTWWTFLKYICPVVIFVVLLNVFGVFGDFVGG